MVFAIEAIWLLPLPAVIQIFCNFIIVQWFHNSSILTPEIAGDINYKTDGQVSISGNEELEVTAISTRYAPLFLSINCGSIRYLLWRDSCEEADYRWIIFNEKRRRSASVVI